MIGMEPQEYHRMAAVEDDMWFYRALRAHVERALSEALSAEVQSSQTSIDILDAGCGTGGLIRWMEGHRVTWRWTGVDLNPLACAFARERCAAKILEASVTALPFGDASFDAVVLADVLYHLEDDIEALREARRVLKPGGMIVINVPAYPWLWSYHDVATQAKRRYLRGDLITRMEAVGFVAVRATHWNTLPLPMVILRRKVLPPPRTGSDVRLYPAGVERLLNMAMALERGWLRRVGRLPFGSSLFAVGKKARE